ncbi:hypothetical protein MnTg02_03168 [bacterium MnTg02]|nr:hypothetical protein MnTg02_03168 [bacterium MnTg02]
MNLIRRPPPIAPMTNCIIPAMKMVMLTNTRTTITWLSPRAMMSGSFSSVAMIEVTITDIGAVGTEIWPGVPPNKLVRIPATTTPYSPVRAPCATYSSPRGAKATMPNAIASGRAITDVVIPPMISPLMLENIFNVSLLSVSVS